MSGRISAGQTWFVVLPGATAVSCVVIEEVTRKTVALRGEPDLQSRNQSTARWVRTEVRFVERIP